jgi:ABC-type uncharacterized transport system auxiliary subunit
MLSTRCAALFSCRPPLAVAPALALLLASCGTARPSKYYSLELPTASPANSKPFPVALLVGHITAPHLFRDDRIVYRMSTGEIGTYQYHRWAEPPTDMLEGMLLRLLRASEKYQTVQHLSSNARGDYIVRGKLEEMEEVSGPPLIARVTMEIELYEQKSGTTVWSHFYSHDEPVQGKEVPNLVAALNRNLHRGLDEVAVGLDQYFATHPQK